MKLATLRNGSRDGQLAVVSRDLKRAISVDVIAPTLQRALDEWERCEPQLARLALQVEDGAGFAFDPTQYVRGALRLVPPGYRVRAGEVLGAIGYTLKWWLIGQGVTMLVIATATWLGLLVLGVPLALVLGVIAGLFNFIPNFGPLFSMVPATLLALTVSPGTALGVIILFIVLQNLEGNLLTPLIQRKAVDLPPALGIITMSKFSRPP